MATMLNVYNLNRQKTAVLQNACQITETQELNKIYSLSFQLPAADEKAQYIQAYHYVRYGEDGELYRIISVKKDESDTSMLSVSCEHVIATLVDDLMFGTIQYGGASIKTAAVIRYLLGKQKTANWQLAECDFERQFEYLWEQENILNALYSIPREFTKAYRWSFDTVQYPWKLSLKAIDETVNPEYYIRAKSNLLGSEDEQDFTGICTRIYPLGYGEGVNQLTIKEINGGLPYLQAPAEVVARYGIKEKVLVDRRYENAKSLKAYGQTMLDALSIPSMSRSFSVVDLYPLTGAEIDNAQTGQVCKLTGDGTITYITKTIRVLDDPGDLQIELSTKSTDVADIIADLADRVRIESVYAQGATQIYQHAKDANATPTKGMIMSLYFPGEMRQINKVLLRLKLNKFRSYSQATDSKTVTIKTNKQALTGLKTTAAGGGTTSSNGGTTVTVGGGSLTGNSTPSTDDKGVTVSVSASGVSYAPQETTTSEPSTDVTSGMIWSGDRTKTNTEAAPNGAVNVALGDGNSKIYGGTYALYSGNDGYHSHSTEYVESGTIDGGAHHHNVSVDIPVKTFDVVVNDPDFTSGGRNHIHYIALNGLAHKHNINHYHTVNVSGSGSGGNHSHTFQLPAHTHSLSSHSHNLPDLSHNHEITLDGHSHTITAGIFESGSPTAFDIYVGGAKKATVNAKSYTGDITAWLLNESNQIPRNTWIDVEIRPNDLAYVVSSVFVQGFVQSRGGGNY